MPSKLKVRSLLRVLAWLYPLAIWLLHDRSDLRPLGFALFFLLTCDLLLSLSGHRRLWVVGSTAILASLLLFLRADSLLRLYPFLMSSNVLYLFLSSSRPDDNPMIGPLRRFIKLEPPFLNLLHRAKRIWIVGLSLNTLILFGFLFGFETETWALYAGAYSYLLLLFLFALSCVYIELGRRRLG